MAKRLVVGIVAHEILNHGSDAIVGLEEIQHRAADVTEGYGEMT